MHWQGTKVESKQKTTYQLRNVGWSTQNGSKDYRICAGDLKSEIKTPTTFRATSERSGVDGDE